MLFKVEKLKKNVAVTAGDGVVDNSDQLIGGSQLEKVIRMVDHGRTVHWVSEGDWSMHHLLQKLLALTGKADVWISSYAFSEQPARIIADLKARGIISNLVCIVDSRVDVRSAGALNLVKNTANVCVLMNTHAKVTVIRNEQWFLVVAGSANYTSNKRYEAGIISCDAGIASFHTKWIENAVRSGK